MRSRCVREVSEVKFSYNNLRFLSLSKPFGKLSVILILYSVFICIYDGFIFYEFHKVLQNDIRYCRINRVPWSVLTEIDRVMEISFKKLCNQFITTFNIFLVYRFYPTHIVHMHIHIRRKQIIYCYTSQHYSVFAKYLSTK